MLEPSLVVFMRQERGWSLPSGKELRPALAHGRTGVRNRSGHGGLRARGAVGSGV